MLNEALALLCVTLPATLQSLLPGLDDNFKLLANPLKRHEVLIPAI